MSRSARPRKKHRPRPATLPICFGMSSAMKTDLALPPHLILETFRAGPATEGGAHTLAAAVNLGAVLARKHNEEARMVMNRGLAAMSMVMLRGKSGQWGMSGDEFDAVAEALNLSDEIQHVSTRAEVRDAIQVVMREAT